MFADEKAFVCNPRPNRRNDVTWTDDPTTIEPIVRVAHSVSINAFGAFSASGKSPLFFFSETLTAPLYVSILESTVLPAARDWFPGGHWTYLQDSDPKHTAKLTQDWLRAHVPEYFTREQLSTPSPRGRLGIGREPSLAAPTKNARGVETCSACGVDGGDDGGVLYHFG